MNHPRSSRDKPMVSVVMSCFNDQDCVESAIESIQQQTIDNWELIVVDDGCSDATGQIVDRLAASDDRIRVIHQENQGLTQSLITGCNTAQGKYIARQDADDLSMPTRLELQVAVLEGEADIGLVSCWADALAPDGEFLDRSERTTDSELATADILEFRLGPPAHGSVMFRRELYEAVGGYRQEFYYSQDSDLWARMVERQRIAYVPDVLYRFSRDPESVSGNRREIQHQFGLLGHQCAVARRSGTDEQTLLDQARTLTHALESNSGASAITRRNQVSMSYLIGSQLVANRDPRARRYLGDVIRRCPWHWKAWVRLAQSMI